MNTKANTIDQESLLTTIENNTIGIEIPSNPIEKIP